MYNLAEVTNIKLNILDCVKDVLLSDVERLRRIKELYVREDAASIEDIHMEAVKLVSYIEALEDIKKSIELSIDGYSDVILDNYREDIRGLDIAEMEDVEVDEIEDEEDYTCYPLDINDDLDGYPF